MTADTSPRIEQLSAGFSGGARAAFQDVETLAVLVAAPTGAQELTVPADLTASYGFDLADHLRSEQATAKAGEITRLTLPRFDDAPWTGLPHRVLLAGVGPADAAALRRAGAALARASAGTRALAIVTAGLTQAAEPLEGLVEGLVLGSYQPPFEGSGTGPTPPVARVVLTGELDRAAIERGLISARAAVRARTLAATPSSTKSPQWLADRAVELAQEAGGAAAGLRVSVHDEEWIERTGLTGLAAVGGGSATPPRLVVVEYAPEGASGPPALLVGKGITYDTGGLSLKPREAMVPMKTDMSGAAVVLAAVLAAAEAGLRRRVVAVLPLAENAVSGSSYRPGDVLRMYDGTTVEIGNTDAEGRMVLADALAWGRERFEPDIVIDVATLTGAITLGLGRAHAGLYATTDALAASLTDAGAAAGEPLWRMPLVEDYRSALASPIADLSHITTDPHTGAGSITAALFLQRFVGDAEWAHLDIAGAGRATKTAYEITEGATGFGARTLLRWLAR